MKLSAYLRAAAVALIGAVAAGSCSDDRPDGRAALLAELGRDYDQVIMADIDRLAASAGADALDRLHADDRGVLSLVATADGLDRSAAMLVKYSNPSLRAMAVPVTAPGKLTGALADAGWTAARSGELEVYSRPGESRRVVCDGKLMWVVTAAADARAAEVVEALKARGGDAPAWLADSIAAADAPIYMSVAAPDSTCYQSAVQIDGPRAAIAVTKAASRDGRRLALADAAAVSAPGSVLAAVDTTATVALALALPAGFDIAAAIDRATGGMYLDPDVRRAIGDLDGRLALSVDFGGQSLADPTAWRAALALGTATGRAGEVTAAVADILGVYGVPLTRTSSGFSLGFGGMTLLRGGARDASTVMVSTPGYPASAAPGWDSPARMQARLAAGSPPAMMLGLDGCGLLIDARADAGGADIDIDFSGSRKGFVANLLDVLHAID